MVSKYYPLQQFRSRSDIRELFNDLERAGADLTYAQAGSSAVKAVSKRMTAGGARRGDPLTMAAVDQEARGALIWGDWAMAGKRILSFTPELTQAFLNSDCGDMRIEDVEPAYRAQYFRFDMPDDSPILMTGGGVAFEGAYVVHVPGVSMRICLTGRPDSALPLNEQWRERYDLLIHAQHFNKPAHEVIEIALADDIASVKRSVEAAKAQGMGLTAELAGEALMERQRDRKSVV